MDASSSTSTAAPMPCSWLSWKRVLALGASVGFAFLNRLRRDWIAGSISGLGTWISAWMGTGCCTGGGAVACTEWGTGALVAPGEADLRGCNLAMLGTVPGVTAGAKMLGLLSPQSPRSLVVVVPSPWGLKPGLVECLERLEWLLDCWLMFHKNTLEQARVMMWKHKSVSLLNSVVFLPNLRTWRIKLPTVATPKNHQQRERRDCQMDSIRSLFNPLFLRHKLRSNCLASYQFLPTCLRLGTVLQGQ